MAFIFQARLVIVDSIAAPFRHGFADDMGMRNRILSGMAQNLIKLATIRNLAVRRGRGRSLGERAEPGRERRGGNLIVLICSFLGCSHESDDYKTTPTCSEVGACLR